METKNLPDPSVERNKAWIKGVTETLNQLGDEKLSRCIMKTAGENCAEQMRRILYGDEENRPKDVAGLIEVINKRRREILDADTFWEWEGNKARFRLNSCGCDIVQAGLAEPGPIFCLCSAGLFENLFAPFHNGTVRCEIEKAIGRGDDCCLFTVYFNPPLSETAHKKNPPL